MIVDKEIILKAKEKMGEKAASIIAQDLNLECFDERNLKACCPFHNEDTPSFIWNSKEHFFHCFGCSTNYGIIDHYMSFYNLTYLQAIQKLFENVDIEYRFGEVGVKSERNYQYPLRVEYNRKKVEQYLDLRKISKQTLDYCDVQSDENGNIVFHYYNENDVLMLVKYRPSHKIKKGDPKCWCQKDKDTAPLLFNMNRIDPTRTLVLVEGETDCLSIIEAGYKNCVSVPFGSQTETWVEHNWEWLQQFPKIIIFSDNDAPGIKMRKNIIPRLGSWRTAYVDLPQQINGQKVKDANEVLYYFGKKAIIDLIEKAIEAPLDDFVEIDDVKPFDLYNEQGIITGLQDMDDVLNKLYFGNLVVWTGKRGNGKTVLANQLAISQPLNQGYSVAAFSLELPNPMLRSWVDRNIAGREHITMKNEKIPIIDNNSLIKMAEWRKGRCFLYNNEINRSYQHILKRIEEIVRRKGVKSILLDNFMMVDLECNDRNKYEKQVEFIKELVILARKLYCIIHLVAHPRKTSEEELQNDDVSGSGHITDLAQYVFAIKRFDDNDRAGQINIRNGEFLKGKEPHNFDLSCSILKNRITGLQDKTCMLYFDYPSYRIYDTAQTLWERYSWNTDNSPLPTTHPKEDNTPRPF